MIGESTDFTSQAIAFGYLGLAFGVGTVLGPLIGGTLTYPCDELGPWLPLCGVGQLNQTRPFFLPCLGAALISAVATISNIFVLRETLPAIVEARRARQYAAEDEKEAAVPLLSAAQPPDLEGAALPA
jgi:MFS family permease